MPPDLDHYEMYYLDKLWNLLPAIYRTLDSDVYGTNGPLRELVNRIGAQAATLRRSIDRLWEDQSIESCDDWLIPYIGNLLATSLVPSLDTRGQRLDVFNTIYYRRRKGTVPILEEIATDITGWQARVVEFFRRLSRTRHNLDPALRVPADSAGDNLTLRIAQGLVGQWTGSMIGGWADLRNAFGALHAQGPNSVAPSARPPNAFDEYFHTADVRAGAGRSGWYNIPNLGVFLWRLMSFNVDQTTPVESGNCYTFDPTGREIPIFAAVARPPFAKWTPPQEWQLPGPIGTPLLRAALHDPQAIQLYAALGPDGTTVENNSVGLFTRPGSFDELVDVSKLTVFPPPAGSSPTVMIFPESGRFAVLGSLRGPITVTYHYGFSAPMGAGPYDRRIIGQAASPAPDPVSHIQGGGNALAKPGAMPSIGTVSIDDSLTYPEVIDASAIQQLTVAAANRARPVIRLDSSGQIQPAAWTFQGNPGSSLVLDGLFISGGDVVLAGSFDSVTLTCCTFDPGTAAEEILPCLSSPTALFAQSIDGRDLRPTRLWIEGEVTQLNIDRSILGPVRTRGNGEVTAIIIGNSILQAIPTTLPGSPSQTQGPDADDLALSFANGSVQLTRCTVLGPAYLHTLNGSECIFDDIITVDNTQAGCVRFSAWAAGSVLPRQYQSVQISPPAPLFTSTSFGQPGYAQLLDSANAAILSGTQGATILSGATDGSEMGAFASQKNAIKESSLLAKYQEYMPLGLNPILIHVT